MAKLSRQEAADLIDRFVENKTDPYEWDDFTTNRSSDPLLERVRSECLDVRDRFPPTAARSYCSEVGFNRLRELAAMLRAAKK